MYDRRTESHNRRSALQDRRAVGGLEDRRLEDLSIGFTPDQYRRNSEGRRTGDKERARKRHEADLSGTTWRRVGPIERRLLTFRRQRQTPFGCPHARRALHYGRREGDDPLSGSLTGSDRRLGAL